MKFFNNIFTFFKSKFIEDESKYEINKTIENLNLKHDKLKSSLTQLLFQERKYRDQSESVSGEIIDLKFELEESVKQNDDELSLLLIEKIDDKENERTFLNEQLTSLAQDIKEIHSNKNELLIGISRYKEVLLTYDSKAKALEARKLIKDEISSIKSELGMNSAESTLSKIKDKITMMNIEMSEHTNSELEQRLNTSKKNRVQMRNLERLNKLKSKLTEQKIKQDIIVVS